MTYASRVIPGSPAIDPEAIEQLRFLEDEDQPNVVAELVGLFIQHAAPKITAIRDAIAQGDAQSVKRAAHSLKGSSANIGARGMQQVCERLEQQASAGDLSEAAALLAQLDEESVIVEAALRAEI